MPRFKNEAVVLRAMDWSESSQLVVLLCRERGKVRGLAKGSRRLSPGAVGRFSGGIELCTSGQVIATTRPSTELAAVTEWNLTDDRLHLRRSLPAQRAGLYVVDLVAALLADEDPHPRVYAAVVGALDALTEAVDDERAVWPALARLQWDVLEDVGYRPELDRDVQTDEPLAEAATYHFDPDAGGFTTAGGPDAWRVRAGTLGVLRDLAGGDGGGGEGCIPDASPPGRGSASASGGASGGGGVRAARLMCVYVRHLLGRELPTMGWVLGRGG